MDLRSLECALALAEERHFGRAAERLNMTQPAFSQRIAALETHVGHPLFVRDPAGSFPTKAGQALLKRGRVAVANATAAKDEARMAAAGRLGRLRLGFTQVLLHQKVPEVIADFRRRNPEIEIELIELNSPDQEAALAEGQIDIGLLHPPLAARTLEFRELGGIELVLAMPEMWPEATDPDRMLSECAHLPFLLAPRHIGPAFYDRIIAACQRAGFSPHVVQEATPMSTLIGLAAAGIGTGFVAECLSVIKRPGVRYVRLRGSEAPMLPVAAAWRKDSDNPAVAPFLTVVEELMEF
jgi:DNA-binding transcriptional LysR family regulator